MEFKSLHLREEIVKALDKKGYVTPTPIQEKTIPLLLEKKDVIGIAQTGTGKTAAFVIPILQILADNKVVTSTPRALILAPTRELAAQIAESVKLYGKFLHFKHLEVYGGVGINPQINALRKGVDILIATPGRLMDLMQQGKVNLSKVDFLVLDEADRMLDMGFLKDVVKITAALPKVRQSLFFSATMSNEISKLTKNLLKNPVRVEITPQSMPVDRIEQSIFFVDQDRKNELLIDIIEQYDISCALVFVAAKFKADRIVKVLRNAGVLADSIHGNKSQNQRTKVLDQFKNGKIEVLVATDIAARGIDVSSITHVINYDLPNEPENYVHRIGRTGRAGKTGVAYSFCAASDRSFLNDIERITKIKISHQEHKHHSIEAKFATGADAKPAPRKQRPPRRDAGQRTGGYSGGRGSSPSRGRNDSRGRDSRGSSYSPRGGSSRDTESRDSRGSGRREDSRGRSPARGGSSGRSRQGSGRDSSKKPAGGRKSFGSANRGSRR
ncbi:MAG: ATP-dependent RNA helicase RhlE [Patescibacteria group bacterium]|jgi:ATP-dependent RNA helicase RhlE